MAQKIKVVDLHELHKSNGADADTIKATKGFFQIYHSDDAMIKQSMMLNRELAYSLYEQLDDIFTAEIMKKKGIKYNPHPISSTETDPKPHRRDFRI